MPGFEPVLVSGDAAGNPLLPKQPLDQVVYICEMTLLVAHNLVPLVLCMFIHSKILTNPLCARTYVLDEHLCLQEASILGRHKGLCMLPSIRM